MLADSVLQLFSRHSSRLRRSAYLMTSTSTTAAMRARNAKTSRSTALRLGSPTTPISADVISPPDQTDDKQFPTRESFPIGQGDLVQRSLLTEASKWNVDSQLGWRTADGDSRAVVVPDSDVGVVGDLVQSGAGRSAGPEPLPRHRRRGKQRPPERSVPRRHRAGRREDDANRPIASRA